jgi:hypothetical protein
MSRFAPGYLASLATAVAVGITLVVLAIPRLGAGLSELHGTWAIAELRSGAPVSGVDIGLAIGSLNAANSWLENAQRHSALSRLYYAGALLTEADSESRRAALLASRDASRRAIELNPALPEPWLRLAQTEYALDRISPQMIRALSMTYRTGQYNRFTVFAMTELAFLAWGQLEPEIRARASEQIVFAMKQRKKQLVAISVRLRAVPIVRRALRDEPELLASFDRAVARREADG